MAPLSYAVVNKRNSSNCSSPRLSLTFNIPTIRTYSIIIKIIDKKVQNTHSIIILYVVLRAVLYWRFQGGQQFFRTYRKKILLYFLVPTD